MPIKPENRKLYPADWKEIRQRILNEAGNKCEFCKVPNHAMGYRRKSDKKFIETGIGHASDSAVLDGDKVIKIILTIAHLDHDPRNNARENLRALCQKCHNSWDASHRKENARRTRDRNKKQEVMDFGG